MTARLRPALTAAALAAALALTAVPASAAPGRPCPPPTWKAVELGTLGGERTTPTAVNDRGQVVGRSQVADGRWHAFLWVNGVMTDLTPDAQDSTATDISDRGHVSGWVQPQPGEDSDAFVWRRGTTTVVAEGAYGTVVNERGQVGGVVAKPETWSENPFVWTAGTRVDLPPPPFPGARSVASIKDLNDKGVVLGDGEYDDDSDLAYVWSKGTFTELRDDGAVLRGVDLSNRGRVAGSVGLGGGLREAALWRGGGIVRLGALPGTASSQAYALNDKDVVVGVSAVAPGQRGTGFVWRAGVLTPVTTSGWSVATDVNERGQVAGALGSTSADLTQPFVWQGGHLQRLGRPTSDDVDVVDLSDKGHVLTVTGDFLAERGVLWTPTPAR